MVCLELIQRLPQTSERLESQRFPATFVAPRREALDERSGHELAWLTQFTTNGKT
jgi:hypothetical protein